MKSEVYTGTNSEMYAGMNSERYTGIRSVGYSGMNNERYTGMNSEKYTVGTVRFTLPMRMFFPQAFREEKIIFSSQIPSVGQYAV